MKRTSYRKSHTLRQDNLHNHVPGLFLPLNLSHSSLHRRCPRLNYKVHFSYRLRFVEQSKPVSPSASKSSPKTWRREPMKKSLNPLIGKYPTIWKHPSSVCLKRRPPSTVIKALNSESNFNSTTFSNYCNRSQVGTNRRRKWSLRVLSTSPRALSMTIPPLNL